MTKKELEILKQAVNILYDIDHKLMQNIVKTEGIDILHAANTVDEIYDILKSREVNNG